MALCTPRCRRVLDHLVRHALQEPSRSLPSGKPPENIVSERERALELPQRCLGGGGWFRAGAPTSASLSYCPPSNRAWSSCMMKVRMFGFRFNTYLRGPRTISLGT